MLKCNMLESTDPELAVALRRARDENHQTKSHKPDIVPPLNLELLQEDSMMDESNLPEEEATESEKQFDGLLTDVVMADESLNDTQ